MSISIYYQNVRGLRTKSQNLYSNIVQSYFDVICLTESSLTDSFHNAELFDHRYTVFRRDRSQLTSHKKGGGGALIAVKTSISPKISILSNYHSSAEDLWVSLVFGTTKIRICCVYMPNNVPNIVSFEEHLRAVANVCIGNPDELTIMVDDYNLPSL